VLIAILSRKRTLYSTRRLREEAEKLGHEIRIIDPIRCVLSLTARKPLVMYNRRPQDDVSVVIPRVGTYAVPYSIAVVRQFRFMGVATLNDDDAIGRARNKLRCLQHLVQRGIRIPETLIARFPAYFERLFGMVGGPPVVLKLITGTQGTGVILSDSLQSAKSSLEAIWSLGHDIMMQKFISESRGKDIRALVVDGKVRAAMRRIASAEEFRSNIHRGGVGEPIRLSRAYAEAAVRAAESVGLRLAGVDLLEGKDGPLVIEVNASPGFQGLEAATGENIARMIVEAATRLARKKKNARARAL
jgi:ribosomal protein S6--L-glutamate ligase